MPTTVHVVSELQAVKDYASGSRARATFDHSHWEIHQGNSYTTEYDDSSMGANDYFAIGFQTSGSGEVHMLVDFASKAEATVDIIEDAFWSGGQTGIQVDIKNRNRQSSNVSSVLTDWRETGVFEASGNVHVGMSGLVGTTLRQIHGYGPRQAGNVLRGDNEFILQTGTKYAVKLTAVVASNAGSLALNWYEES